MKTVQTQQDNRKNDKGNHEVKKIEGEKVGKNTKTTFKKNFETRKSSQHQAKQSRKPQTKRRKERQTNESDKKQFVYAKNQIN